MKRVLLTAILVSAVFIPAVSFALSLGQIVGGPSSQNLINYHLDTNLNDTSGNSNTLILGTATRTTGCGRFGTDGLNAAGSVQSASSTNNSGISGNATTTYVAWFKQNATSSGQAIVYLGGYTNAGTGGTAIFVYVTGVNALDFGTFSGDNFTATSSIATGTWYNLIAVKLPGAFTSSTMTLYLNGVKQTLFGTGSATTANITASHLEVGELSTGAPFPFNGCIDEVQLFNTAWTAQQVSKYYAQAKGRFAPYQSQ